MSPDFYVNTLLALLNPTTLLSIFIGASVGQLMGILPGISAVSAVALLLPVTRTLEPVDAIAMLAGIWYGSSFGGIITSVLFNIPGEGDSVIATLDGYALAQKGRAAFALGVAAFGGFFAGTVALVVMALIGPTLANAAMRFGPPEFFALMLLGLALVTWLSGKSMVKGIAATLIGLLVGTVGVDFNTGEGRLTFGQLELLDGIGFVPAVVGLYGIGEILYTIGTRWEAGRKPKFDMRALFPRSGEWSGSVFPTLRGAAVGYLAGSVPGVGPMSTTFIAYALEKKLSRNPEKFGQGAIEGVSGPEAANNAAVIAGLGPLLMLGLPVGATTALLLGAFMMHGLIPGPLLYRDHIDIVWSLIMSLYIANIVLLLENTVLVPALVWALDLIRPYVTPMIGVLTVVGAFSINSHSFDIWLALAFGLLGYVFRVGGFPLPPLVIALVLGGKAETALRQSLVLSVGDFLVFFTRPASAVLMVVAFLVLASPAISWCIRSVRKGWGKPMVAEP